MGGARTRPRKNSVHERKLEVAIPEREPLRVSDHGIEPSDLDPNALKVVETLHENGFDAYLVGGCVRDLMCGEKPKDFDVATDATPEQVKELFRRARLVGRRFPIAHVRFGRNIIEVSTFRQGQLEHVETTEQGLIVKDHVSEAWQKTHFVVTSR